MLPPARLTLTVEHDGMVHLSTCPDCTGEPEDAIEVLEQIAAMLRRGVDDHGRHITTFPGTSAN